MLQCLGSISPPAHHFRLSLRGFNRHTPSAFRHRLRTAARPLPRPPSPMTASHILSHSILAFTHTVPHKPGHCHCYFIRNRTFIPNIDSCSATYTIFPAKSCDSILFVFIGLLINCLLRIGMTLRRLVLSYALFGGVSSVTLARRSGVTFSRHAEHYLAASTACLALNAGIPLCKSNLKSISSVEPARPFLTLIAVDRFQIDFISHRYY